MPGWPIRIYVSGAGHTYHRTDDCGFLKAGQKKSRERGHVVTKVICVWIVESKDVRRRPCQGCVPRRG